MIRHSFANDVREIYRQTRKTVEMRIRLGLATEQNSDSEFKRIASVELEKIGRPVPKVWGGSKK